MARRQRNLAGAGALLGAAAVYGSFALLIREMANMFGDNAQVLARLFLALLIISVINFIRKKSPRLPTRTMYQAIALGLAFVMVMLLFTVAVNNTTIANSVILLYAGSIVSSLVIGTFALREEFDTTKLIAIAVAVAGLSMYFKDLLAVSLGVVTGLSSGLFAGVANALRKALRGVDRNVLLQYQFAFGSLFAFVVMLTSGEEAIREVSCWPIAITVIFAMLQIWLGHLLLYGFQNFDVNIGTVVLATELIFASILGYIAFHEMPATNEIIGGLLILTASVLSAIEFDRLAKPVPKR